MKKLLTYASFALVSASALASYNQAPPAFAYKNAKAVYIDLQDAHYDITYDYAAKSVSVETLIHFDSATSGYPIFDLVNAPSEVLLDGKAILTTAITDPENSTTLRVMENITAPGSHELRIKHNITANVVFGATGVASGFWTSDLNDRRYLEQYLPTNMEYDQYSMQISVNVTNTNGLTHILKTNGKVAKISENSFEVSYPEFYTASSLYFHMYPTLNAPTNISFYYQSIDGRLLPVDIYTNYDPQTFASATRTILAELENDYGPFPHEQVLIYGNAPSGGMEYSGATATSLSALGHELFHCYHARALMPANGNAGWMDEAIARFRDNKYPLTQALTFASTRLAGHSVWTRSTDRMAYKEGSAFLSWIAYRMDQKGLSFKGFLRSYFDQYKYTTVTTELFRDELSKEAGMDLSPEFDQYIYGKSSMNADNKGIMEEDEFHPHFSKAELHKMTMP
jgi:hypothetical protein